MVINPHDMHLFIKEISKISRDKKIELLQQLFKAYCDVYNMDCTTIKQECVKEKALDKIIEMRNIIKHTLLQRS